MITGTLAPSDDLGMQLVSHRDGRGSYIVLDMATGSVHARQMIERAGRRAGLDL